MKTSFRLVFLILPVLLSCTNYRKAIYFDINQDLETKMQTFNSQAVIQRNDLLSVSVRSLSPEASAVYNAPTVLAGSGATSVPGGYLVAEDGRIQFPVLGYIPAAGLTKAQLEEHITKRLLEQKLLLDPLVSVRIINYRVTVLGEVASPMVVNVPSEKINLLEAIGYAGDLTLFADRSNVLVIREENGVRKFKMLNLNTSEIFSSPYFNLRHNDVVYVRPNKVKVSNSSPVRIWLPTVFSAISMAIIILRYSTR